MRLRMYWSYAIRSLARGGQRTVFAVFCVAVGVLVIVALQLVGNMLDVALTSNVRALNGGDIAVHSELHDLNNEQLAYFEQLKRQGVITAYTPSGGAQAFVARASGFHRFSLDTVDPAIFPLGGPLDFVAPANGSLATLLQGNTVVVTRDLMQSLNLHVGQTLTITTDTGRTANLDIGGVVANTGFFAGRPDMLISEQQYLALPSLSGAGAATDSYTWIWVNVPGHSDAAASATAAEIVHHFPLTTATTAQQAAQNWQTEIDAVRNFLRIVGLLALLIGGIGIINTMQVLLCRRLLEIAMLKTQGYRQRDLMLMFGIEAALLGVVGGALGAAAGAGMSLLVRTLINRAIFLDVPAVVDPLTVGSGVLIGCVTALIFGLLPITQNSAIRPLAVLREAPEPGGCRRAVSSMLLVGLLGFLFFLLALGILRNPLIAAGVVAGAGVLLFGLTFAFAGLTWLVSRASVPDTPRLGYVLPVGLAALAGAALIRIAPGFGALVLALALCGLLALALPRAAKASIRMALRNIGRAKIRSATTLVALFGGVFAIGLGLTLGQGLKDTFAQLDAQHVQDNVYVLASSGQAPAVREQLANTPGVTREIVLTLAADRTVAVNGVPIQQPTPGTNTGDGPSGSALENASGLIGADLGTKGMPPITLEQGVNDTHKGRVLTAADASTTNALAPLNDSQAPLSLKLGDTLTVGSSQGDATVALHIVGFYSYNGLVGGDGMLVDTHVALSLSGGKPAYVFAAHVDPAAVDEALQRIRQAAPGVITLSDQDILQELYTILDNVIGVIESVASLAMLAGLLMIANAVALAMLERRREMGILKSVGHTSRSVLGTVLLENAALGAAGAFCAMLLVSAVAAVLGRLAFKNWATSASQTPLVLGLVAATALICMAVAGGVAWRATRVRPLAVLRYE